ncbi:LptF/LptG family permease, partial [Elusimicrobiota bacterium]
MKTLKRYVFTSFLRQFLKCISAVLILMMVTHFFDFLHVFLENKPSLFLLINYFSFRIPEWFITILPVSMLLAVLFSLGTLDKHHETTAIKSSGIKITVVLKPLVAFSIFISLISVLLFSMIVPNTNSHAENLFLTIKKKKPRQIRDTRKDFTYMGKNN